MSSDKDEHTRLTTAERNSIIQNESRGIQHPLYYVCHTKSGKVQVRKRRTPLVNGSISSHATTTVQPQQQEQSTEDTSTSDRVNYDSVSNRELLERMLDVLQKNVNSNDEEKNSVENERITQENQQFIDNIVKANEQDQTAHVQPQSSASIVQPTRVVRRGRVLI